MDLCEPRFAPFGEEVIEEGKEARHQPTRHHRVGMDRHLSMIMTDRHVEAEGYSTDRIENSKNKELARHTLHQNPPLIHCPAEPENSEKAREVPVFYVRRPQDDDGSGPRLDEISEGARPRAPNGRRGADRKSVVQ